MTITYTKTQAHGYTYWTIKINDHIYRENGHKELFSTRKDAELYANTHILAGIETKVNGLTFRVWSDTTLRSTNALCIETGEAKTIHSSGYIHKDLSIRKAIALSFQLPTFKSEVTTKTETKKVLTDEQKAKKAARAKARREARKAAQA